MAVSDYLAGSLVLMIRFAAADVRCTCQLTFVWQQPRAGGRKLLSAVAPGR